LRAANQRVEVRDALLLRAAKAGAPHSIGLLHHQRRALLERRIRVSKSL